MNWENYIIRRRIDVGTWLIRQGISSREDFIEKLGTLSIEPPDESTISSLFPPKTQEVIIDHEPEAPSIPAERIDTTTSRSLAPQGGGAGLRTGGNDGAKLRDRRNK